MTIEQAILSSYKKETKTNEPDVDLLFDVVSNYIKEMDWIYEGNASQQGVHKLQEQRKLKVNCFILTDLFIHMSKQIGIPPDECFQVVIPYFVGAKANCFIEGAYEPFTLTYSANSDGFYEFDVHCIAMIKHSCFDLLLQAKYPLVNDGADIYSSLGLAMNDDNLEQFKSLLLYLLDINEQDPPTGWTLLHDALSKRKFDFAIELLKKGAEDNILDNCQSTPLDILNNQLYDPSVTLVTLEKAREYQNLKMELIIKNKAARIIQTFWQKNHKTSKPHVEQESKIEKLGSARVHLLKDDSKLPVIEERVLVDTAPIRNHKEIEKTLTFSEKSVSYALNTNAHHLLENTSDEPSSLTLNRISLFTTFENAPKAQQLLQEDEYYYPPLPMKMGSFTNKPTPNRLSSNGLQISMNVSFSPSYGSLITANTFIRVISHPAFKIIGGLLLAAGITTIIFGTCGIDGTGIGVTMAGVAAVVTGGGSLTAGMFANYKNRRSLEMTLDETSPLLLTP